jgi:hypothetical protein
LKQRIQVTPPLLVENVVTQGSTDTASTGSSVATGTDPGAVDPVLAYKFDQTQAKSNCNTTTSEESPCQFMAAFCTWIHRGTDSFYYTLYFTDGTADGELFYQKQYYQGKRHQQCRSICTFYYYHLYTGVGLLLTAIFGADALNVLSTNAVFNVVLFLLFIAFAFSFFGYYELTLPSSWANKTESMSSRGGFPGYILYGIYPGNCVLFLYRFDCRFFIGADSKWYRTTVIWENTP